MPQPVQPPQIPEIPALVESVTPEDEPTIVPSSETTPVSASTETLQTNGLAAPTPPETFAPESSALTTPQPAALLGPPISIRYPVQSVQSSSVQESEFRSLESVSDSSGLVTQSPPVLPTSNATQAETRESVTLTSSPASSDTPFNNSSITLDTSTIQRLVAQERGGEVREFEFPPTPETQSSPQEEVSPVPASEETPNPPPASPPSETTAPTEPSISGVLELTADQQEYDDQRQIITAEGNVVLRFRQAVLDANRVQINLPNRILVAEGDVALRRGNQVLRGERFEYYFVQDSGVILNANGELYTPTTGSDLSLLSPSDGTTGTISPRPGSDRILNAQPLQGIYSPGAYSFSLGAFAVVDAQTGGTNPRLTTAPPTGTINRFRYEAERVDFEGSDVVASNVRITNDPFSPPELELRADTARFTRLSPLVDEIVASRPRLVFDQGLSVPTFRNRVVIDRREREPGLINFGFDQEDRGGLFAERTFEIINTPTVRFRVTPQYFIQKAVFDEGIADPSVFGLRSQLNVTLSPRTTLTGLAVFTSLNPDDFENNLRASLRLQQTIGTTLPHTLNLEYSYRDRLFNGSLGFQTVQRSFGAVLISPYIPLGQTGIVLNYQAGIQSINADTDQLDLLDPDRDNNRVNLTRYQAAATLSRPFMLWQGEALPPTPTEGLRYTPAPVVPNVQLTTSLSGVATAYSNGDTQNTLSGTVGLSGQFGHFSRPFLDYTGFNISYGQLVLDGQSPFLFDRSVDQRFLSAGITQQLYGPFRIGFQTYINLDTGKEISTDYFVEYSRRTYNLMLRFNPVLALGSISFRINDFNWTGNPGLFDGSEIRPVTQGVTQ